MKVKCFITPTFRKSEICLAVARPEKRNKTSSADAVCASHSTQGVGTTINVRRTRAKQQSALETTEQSFSQSAQSGGMSKTGHNLRSTGMSQAVNKHCNTRRCVTKQHHESRSSPVASIARSNRNIPFDLHKTRIAHRPTAHNSRHAFPHFLRRSKMKQIATSQSDPCEKHYAGDLGNLCQ